MNCINKSLISIAAIVAGFLVGCDNNTGESKSSDKSHYSDLQVEQVLVPAGEFTRGSDKEDDIKMRQQYGFPAPLYLDEHPQKRMYLDAYKIDTYEVTNKQYKAYINNAKQMLPHAWMSNGYAISREQLEMLDIEKLRKM
ncbi:formylglycine-generating enzyme family protein, partial [Kaarinaea lacus]